jgi:hypothetical protein
VELNPWLEGGGKGRKETKLEERTKEVAGSPLRLLRLPERLEVIPYILDPHRDPGRNPNGMPCLKVKIEGIAPGGKGFLPDQIEEELGAIKNNPADQAGLKGDPPAVLPANRSAKGKGERNPIGKIKAHPRGKGSAETDRLPLVHPHLTDPEEAISQRGAEGEALLPPRNPGDPLIPAPEPEGKPHNLRFSLNRQGEVMKELLRFGSPPSEDQREKGQDEQPDPAPHRGYRITEPGKNL